MKKPIFSPQSPSQMRAFGFVAIVLVAFILGWNTGVSRLENRQEAGNTSAVGMAATNEKVDMRLFWDTWNLVYGKYVDPQLIDSKDMLYGAIHGMVSALGDPYTTFMTPKENKDFQDALEGTLEGIGAELTLKNNLLTVISPLKNSPAKRAGLQPGDVIYEINGEQVDNLTLEQAVMKIRGERGTSVNLTIVREGHEDPIKMTIKRETISIESVQWKMKDGMAVIELNQFGNNTKQEFSRAVNEILTKRPKGIVLDLRYNGGGYLEGAVDIVSEFMEKGQVVTIKKRNPEEDETIYVSGKARLTSLPLAVIINKGSASASEIVAGAIQDQKRGVVIGENSFGKGTVQEVDHLVDGSSLRVTIAKWYTPGGRNITEKGIMPDTVVKRTVEDLEKGKDPQLEAAIDYLKGQAK